MKYFVVSPLNKQSNYWNCTEESLSLTTVLQSCRWSTDLQPPVWAHVLQVNNLRCQLGELRTEVSLPCVHGQGVTNDKEMSPAQLQLKTLPSPQEKGTHMVTYHYHFCWKQYYPGSAKGVLKGKAGTLKNAWKLSTVNKRASCTCTTLLLVLLVIADIRTFSHVTACSPHTINATPVFSALASSKHFPSWAAQMTMEPNFKPYL